VRSETRLTDKLDFISERINQKDLKWINTFI
jgi:hypothetical protein